MLSVVTKLPSEPTGKPPVIFVHGAGTSAPVWMFWQAAFVQAGWPTHNLDLRGHGASGAVDLREVGIFDYVDDVNAVADQLDAPPVVVGWEYGRSHRRFICRVQGRVRRMHRVRPRSAPRQGGRVRRNGLWPADAGRDRLHAGRRPTSVTAHARPHDGGTPHSPVVPLRRSRD